MNDVKNNNLPLVSVIMGVYNCPSYSMLESCVESILLQTYKNLEFIICDDASTNDTWEWLNLLAKKDSRIILIQNKENLHLASSLNKCIAISKGKYLARQDVDDISYDDRIAEEVKFLEENEEISFVGTSCWLYNPKEGIVGKRDMTERPQKKDFLFNSPFIHGSLLFRRNCLNINSCYPVFKNISRYEDYAMFMTFYSKGIKGANLPQVLYKFHYDRESRCVPAHERIDEVKIRWDGFRKLNLFPKAFPYLLKPLILILIPQKSVHWLREHFREKYKFKDLLL